MDKNMIHIDELFRERLTGAEESERSGAWMRMRELLDEQMPQGAPIAVNPWRKILSYTAGVLITAAVSVGSYKTMVALNNDNTATAANIETSVDNDLSTLADNTQLAHILPAGATFILKDGKAVVMYDPAITSYEAIIGSITEYSRSFVAGKRMAIAQHNIYKNTISGEVIASNVVTQNHAANRSVNYNTIGNDGRMSINTATVIASNMGTDVYGTGTVNGAVERHPVRGTIKEVVAPRSNKPSGSATRNSSNNRKQARSTANAIAARKKAMLPVTVGDINVQPLGNTNNVGNNANNANNNTLAIAPSARTEGNEANQYDSLQEQMGKVEIRERWVTDPVTRTRVYKTDTIANTTISFPKLVPKGVKPKKKSFSRRNENEAANEAAVRQSDNNTSSSVGIQNSATTSDFTITPHATFKKEGWNMQRFNDMVTDMKNNMKYDIANAQFYPGIIAGLNTIVGPSSWGGFQFGITGNVEFNDRLTVTTELKYLHRFNAGTVLRDNYTTFVTPTTNTWRQDQVSHFFRYSALQSLELPVSVRYAAGNFTIFVGGSLIYNFAINAQESNTIEYGDLQTGEIPATFNAASESPRYNIRDFRARYGLGYLFGTAYRLSPALQLDLRMTQSLWDNANTFGAQQLSSDIFQMPSLQLSIGYRFDQQRRY